MLCTMMTARRYRTKKKTGKTKLRQVRWCVGGQVMQNGEFCHPEFPKERGASKFVGEVYSISSRNSQLVPRKSSHRCVACCCLHTSENYPSSVFSLSFSFQLFPPFLVTFSRQHSKVLVIRCLLMDTEDRSRQQTESEIISHLCLILFMEKESSEGPLCTEMKADTLKHTNIQNNVQK